MSEEVKFKINMPMFEDGELERFDDNIHNIASEFTKMYLKEKDMILSQRLVMKLEEENTELQQKIDKAIEYIEKCIDSEDIYEQFISTGETKELLDILKGDKNE